jgi:CubicO group peptidase (beta-lactamase class C family)
MHMQSVHQLRKSLLVLCGVCLPLLGGAAEQLPAPLQTGAPTTVSAALQLARWHMLDPDISSVMFRSMDRIFTIREVPRAGAVWVLPRRDQPLEVRYDWAGQQYNASQFLERTYGNALLVIKDGRIINETYRNGTDRQSRFIAWSMTKSVTSILIGCALAEGFIDSLDTPISRYLPELQGGGYQGVTIRQVMQMRSGVDYEERYDFDHPGTAASNHIASLVQNVARFADAARTIKRLHPPGEVFQYKTLDTAVLGWLLERATRSTVAAYTAKCLWEPLGAESNGFYIMDGQPGVGREFSGAGFNATLTDFGRIGQMVLNGGVADGRRIVSAEWIAQSTRSLGPTDRRSGGYGLQWWTMADGRSFAAIGLQGQYIYIDPATRTVVVKLSYYPPGDASALDGETLAFMAAVSAWQPH